MQKKNVQQASEANTNVTRVLFNIFVQDVFTVGAISDVFITSLAELPGCLVALYIIDRLGRKKSQATSMKHIRP